LRSEVLSWPSAIENWKTQAVCTRPSSRAHCITSPPATLWRPVIVCDDAEPLGVDPEPEKVRLKHFRALKLLIEVQVQYDLCIRKRIYINNGNSAYCTVLYLCSVS